MDTDTVLGLLDEESKIKAFKQCLTTLETAPRLDLDALRVCIKLRPPLSPTFKDVHAESNDASSSRIIPEDEMRLSASTQTVERSALAEKLCDLLLSRIPYEPLDSDHVFNLIEILCSDGPFAHVLFRERIHTDLVAILPGLSKHTNGDVEESNDAEGSMRQNVRKATAYLTLLKCSFWLPSICNHVVEPGLLRLLSRFLGLSVLDEIAHDTISALLSLLRRGEPLVVARPRNTTQSWLEPGSVPGQVVLAGSFIDDGSLWDQLRKLEPKYFTTGITSSKVFRTWFQWISQAVADRVRLECLHDHSYWERARTGLLLGHADQRKYCIGIIRQSLLVAQSDICTPTMYFRLAERTRYMRAYEQYSDLFETIVLDRYANQVQACLPELTRVFKSEITSLMASTLLSAALNPMVQDGIRKIIGNWYIEYVVNVRGDLGGHVNFLLEGLLPWATVGELFTSTLVSTRDTTVCVHGASLAEVVARFVTDTPDTLPLASSIVSDTSSELVLHTSRRAVILGVLDFILDARGRIFQFSILYLLEGLIKGLRACAGELALQDPFTSVELDKICRISRLPGLPEIASDLYCEFCCQLCDLTSPGGMHFQMPAYQQLRQKAHRLMASMESNTTVNGSEAFSGDLLPLQALRKRLEDSKHRWIQGDNYAPVCKDFIRVLDRTDPISIKYTDLYAVLDAFWEEADRRQFCRPVAIHIPPVLFHSTCMQVLVRQQSSKTEGTHEDDLQALLSRAMVRLQQLSEGRTYILSILAISIRKATFSCPDLMHILPLEDYILRFLNHPPTTRPEFLFEVAAAENLQRYHSHRTYYSYYGEKEWYAYAATIDLLQRFPDQQTSVAKRILDHLLQPWKAQRAGIPIISKWKKVSQLQAMLLLADFCIPETEADVYLASFKHALNLEAWPRYRFLLEWIIARIYCRFPGKTSRILEDLARLEANSSTHIASLMKLAVLVAPRQSEDFSFSFMTHLVPFSASPKVQIRHESNYAIPIIFKLALSKGWTHITTNPAFESLDAFIRRLDKFQSTPWTIRTLKLDIVKDFTLVNIFQGQYLTIESAEKERVAYEDFVALHDADRASGLNGPPERVPLGTRVDTGRIATRSSTKASPQPTSTSGAQVLPAFFQTKSGFDIDSLHPQSGPPSVQNQRPASVILVASLIDNPTNLGGLSRISESFGIEVLYIDDLKKTTHKDFKATSVTSEKHFPIRELKLASVPVFLLDMKRSGYEVVGIEQTDRSQVLGTDCVETVDIERLGTLPKKCVLVLGSEKGGISAEVLAVIDRCVEIRTVGVTRSLNVQTAGGIALYEWWREWYGKA